MGTSKRVPSFQDQSPTWIRGSSDTTLFTTPMAAPSAYAQHCRSASPPLKQLQKTQGRASFGDWDVHHLETPHSVQTGMLPSPQSPSESENSLSAFSTIGSSSSTSSFFNDTCSYSGAGEISPSSVESREAKSAMVSPVRLSFQDMQIGSKLHTFGYRTITASTPKKPEIRGGGLQDGLLEYCFQKGKVIERHVGNAYPDCNSACMSSPHPQGDDKACEGGLRQRRASVAGGNNPIIKNPLPTIPGYSCTGQDSYHMVAGEVIAPSKEPVLAACLSEACDANHHCMDESNLYSNPKCSFQSKQANIGSEHETEQENIQSQDSIHNDGLMEQPAKAKRGLSKVSDKSGKRPNTRVDSCTDVFHDAHEYLKCVSPEIGLYIESLKHLPDLMTPCKEVSLSRALSLHQSPYTYGRPPLIPTPKLNTTPCSPGGLNKEVFQRRSFTGFSSDANGSPACYTKGRQVQQEADGGPLINTRGSSRSSSTIYSNEGTGKIADGLSAWPSRIGYTHNSVVEHSRVSSFLPLVCKDIEKRDALAHSDASCGCESATESPTIFSSKAGREWRSRSLGGKATLKSTARNLEAAFSGYRSASLHKSSPYISKGAAKLDISECVNMVSVGSIDSHKRQPCRLNSFDADVDRKGQCSADMVPCRTPLSRKILSVETNSIACKAKHLVIKPLAPITHKQRRPKFELMCKPLLPVAQSIYQLPSSKGALHSAKPCSSGYTLQGLSMVASKISSPSMSHASVQYTLMDGLSCYTMTMEGTEDMLMAKDCRSETPPSTGGPKWLYTFYSGKTVGKGPRPGGWRRWTKRVNKAPLDVTGIMQVSSRYEPDTLGGGLERQYSLVLEFVLFDGKAHAATHSQSLRICTTDMHKSSVLGSSTEGMWSSSHCTMPSRLSHAGSVETECTHVSMAGGASPISGNGVTRVTTPPLKRSHARHRPTVSLDGWSDSDLHDSNGHMDDSTLPSHMELAAIVIRVPMKTHQNLSNVMHDVDTMGGWGLKFLNGGYDSDVGSRVSQRASLNAANKETVKGSSASVSAYVLHAKQRPLLDKTSSYVCSNEAESTRVMKDHKNDYLDMVVCVTPAECTNVHREKTDSLTLILPKGDHSLPSVAGAKRPSSLIERWQSDGSCECGGWDLGCGIEVLRAGNPKRNATSHTSTTSVISPDQSISIYSQGSRKELMFSLSPVKQGQYKLKFEDKLSALRAFATAVSILHGHHTAPTSPSTSTTPPTSMSTPSSSTSPFPNTH